MSTQVVKQLLIHCYETLESLYRKVRH